MAKLQACVHASALVVLALALALSQGCSRTGPLHRADSGSQTTEQKLPFHSAAAHSSPGSGSGAKLNVPSDSKPAGVLPFRSASFLRILPPETLVTVQLETSLSTDQIQAGETFSGSVAAPLFVDGHIVVDEGTEVTGRVESANPGYFQLTLIAMSNEGRQVALQTSSLFARGYPPPANLHSSGIQVPKGRRLIFRLTAPVFLTESESRTKAQSSIPPKD